MVNKLKPNQTPAAATAEMIVAGLATNAVLTREFSLGAQRDADLTECLKAITDSAARVTRGDFADCEALLAAQAVTLNAVFAQLLYRAHLNMGKHLEATDRYTRLALRAQNQCRATVETISVIKNPPTVFARQANIAQGPQQVNNVLSQQSAGHDRARAETTESRKIELLEAHGERLDSGTTDTTGRAHSPVAAVETLNRPSNR